VLCLDEPTAGVAQRETEAFGPLILEVRRELGATLLVIEHDKPLIMSISDRVYCLELGRVIAEGDPATVRHDPAVVASYLGTDERAIARSGAAATATAPRRHSP
jgi:ABC-type branched-subunit amino acid transport system ATPase component